MAAATTAVSISTKTIHCSLSHLDVQGRLLVRDRTRHIPPGASAGQRRLAHRRHWRRHERPGPSAGPCRRRPPSRGGRRRQPPPRRPSRSDPRRTIAPCPSCRCRRFPVIREVAALPHRPICRAPCPARVSPLWPPPSGRRPPARGIGRVIHLPFVVVAGFVAGVVVVVVVVVERAELFGGVVQDQQPPWGLQGGGPVAISWRRSCHRAGAGAGQLHASVSRGRGVCSADGRAWAVGARAGGRGCGDGRFSGFRLTQ